MNPHSSRRLLAIIVGLSGLVYLFAFTVPFPLSRLYATIPPVDYAKLTGHSLAGFLVYIGSLVLLFGLYVWASRLPGPTSSGNRPSPVGGHFVLISSAVLAAVSVPSYPLTAIDLLVYGIYTRGWALYGLNPLATAPDMLPATDPWLGLAGEWIDAPSPYGPAWEWLSLGAFRLSGGSFLAHLLVLKLVAALAYLGCVWLIYQILRRLRPQWAVPGTIAFAWNPLVLLESVQNGHNDIVMVFFLLAAVRVMIRSGDRTAAKPLSLVQVVFVSLFLASSVLVKFVTILIIPFFWLATVVPQPGWRRRVVAGGLFALLIGAGVVLPMLSLWPGWEHWTVLSMGGRAGRSLMTLIILGLSSLCGDIQAFDIARTAILCIYAPIYLLYLYATLRQVKSAPPHLVACLPAFYTSFWFVLLVAPIYHAWYLLWFIPLASLLLPNRRPLRISVVFSSTALLMIAYFETIQVWIPALVDNQLLSHAISVPLLLGPPVLTFLLTRNRTPEFAG